METFFNFKRDELLDEITSQLKFSKEDYNQKIGHACLVTSCILIDYSCILEISETEYKFTVNHKYDLQTSVINMIRKYLQAYITSIVVAEHYCELGDSIGKEVYNDRAENYKQAVLKALSLPRKPLKK